MSRLSLFVISFFLWNYNYGISLFFQAGPVIETLLSSFPEYMKVKDLPHDDRDFKVSYFV